MNQNTSENDLTINTDSDASIDKDKENGINDEEKAYSDKIKNNHKVIKKIIMILMWVVILLTALILAVMLIIFLLKRGENKDE